LAFHSQTEGDEDTFKILKIFGKRDFHSLIRVSRSTFLLFLMCMYCRFLIWDSSKFFSQAKGKYILVVLEANLAVRVSLLISVGTKQALSLAVRAQWDTLS